MLVRLRFLLCVVLACFIVVESLAAEFYRCLAERQPPSFFQKDACQLLSDPTTPFQPANLPESLPAPKSLPAPETVAEQKPLSRLGSWTVTQILIASGDSLGSGWEKQAVINNRRVGIGAEVDGGRVRDISRTFVIMAHAGGETLVPFDQETVAYLGLKPQLKVAVPEFGKILPQVLQRLALGEEVLIVRDGRPLARLLPVSQVERP